MRAIHTAYRRFIGFLVGIGEIVVAVMCLHIVAEIVANAVFSSPIQGTPEIVARWYMVAIVFLPLAVLYQRGDHISADLLTSKLGPRIQAALDLVINLAMAGMALLLAWYTAGEAWDATARLERIELVGGTIPTWPLRWVVPLGFGTLGLTALLLILSRATALFVRGGADRPGA